MAQIQTQVFCPRCQAYRLGYKRDTNHVAHLLVSIFLCGLWVPIWILLVIMRACYRSRCSVCGTKC